jgi:hypothetical protein
MNMKRHQWLSGVAATAIAMTAIGGGVAFAKGKSARIEPEMPSAERNKSGRLDPPTTERNKSARIEPEIPSAERNKSGRIDPPIDATADDPCKRPGTQCDPRDGGVSTERNKSARIDPPLSVARNKTGWIVPTLAATAAIGGILAASGGSSKPASP